MVQSSIRIGGCGVASTVKAYKVSQEELEAAARSVTKARRAPGVRP